jgi:hypothetical membrane protein
MRPPGWALASSIAAMVFLVGGWSIGAAVQPAGYDPVRQTISALARHGAEHREIMTTGLAGLGLAHLVTAAGLSALRRWSRAVLAVGGLATLGTAVFAQPSHGSSAAHIVLAVIGFVALGIWAATAITRDPGAPAPVRPAPAAVATAVSLGLLVWVGVTQTSGPLGVAERLLTFEQAVWPFVVVVALRRRRTARIGP